MGFLNTSLRLPLHLLNRNYAPPKIRTHLSIRLAGTTRSLNFDFLHPFPTLNNWIMSASKPDLILVREDCLRKSQNLTILLPWGRNDEPRKFFLPDSLTSSIDLSCDYDQDHSQLLIRMVAACCERVRTDASRNLCRSLYSFGLPGWV